MALPTNVATSYPDDGSDPSIGLHQQHHDKIHAVVNLFDKDATPADGDVLTFDDTVYTPTALLNSDGLVQEAKVPQVYFPTIRPEKYRQASDPDDTASITAAFAAAKALMRPGVVANIHHPGATVVMEGVYDCSVAWSAAVEICCNLQASTATVIVPDSYAGIVFLAGQGTSGDILQSADISLPDVIKNGPSSLTASSVGVKVQNLYSSRLNFGRVAYFETGIWFTGLGNGTVYNKIHPGWVSYCKVALKLAPGIGGWVNQNTFIGGGVQQSPSYGGSGDRRSDWKHLQFDGGGINAIQGNTFLGVSFEGDVSKNAIDIRQAVQNTFIGCRSEPGRPGRTVTTTASSTTIALAAHGFAINDMVVFAGTLPAALKINVPYFVVSVPNANSFTVSATKGGTAITIATTTSTGLVYQPHRVNVDASTYSSSEIHFVDTMATLKTLEIVATGSVESITQESYNQRTLDAYQDADRPLFRARNRCRSAVVRALYAAYAPGVNPADDPLNWSTALSDRGLLFGASRAEIGRMWGSAGGTIQYRVPADTADYEIASCRRSPSLIAITSLRCAASTTTSTTITLTGASVRDHVMVTPDGALPAGLVLSDARVSAAGTITIRFANLTGSTISLTINVQAIAFRRFL
jgi:hypothetical protein